MDNRIAAQYYTIRDYVKTEAEFDASCKKVADMGYKTVQISCVPLAAKPMREILDKYGLECVCTHRSFDDFKKDIDEVIDYNRTLGCDICGIGMMPAECLHDGEKITEFIAAANKICEKLKAAGMYFGYHNHNWEMETHDGKLTIERLIEETNPEVFNFIADVYWIKVGGYEPSEILKKMGRRAMAVHFKDFGCDAKGEPEMREIGRGNLDWDDIIGTCREIGTRFAIVEQDTNWIDGDVFKALDISYKYLAGKGFI